MVFREIKLDLSTSQAKLWLGSHSIYLKKGKKCNITHILCCYPLEDYDSNQGCLPPHIFYRDHSEMEF
jgi:hypothetical protein